SPIRLRQSRLCQIAEKLGTGTQVEFVTFIAIIMGRGQMRIFGIAAFAALTLAAHGAAAQYYYAPPPFGNGGTVTPRFAQPNQDWRDYHAPPPFRNGGTITPRFTQPNQDWQGDRRFRSDGTVTPRNLDFQRDQFADRRGLDRQFDEGRQFDARRQFDERQFHA